MPNLNDITGFEKSIHQNKRKINRNKKSIPYVILTLVFLYALLFNISAHKLTPLFDNQLAFIKTLSYSFISIIILYFLYVFLLISKLSKQSKNWNKSIYKLAKLDENTVH
jgi:uncharacterized membrane protein YbjE (DUF340 family)